jgi:hypothetical protein
MISTRTIEAVAQWFVAHEAEAWAELLERQARERERLRCPRLREMLHKNGAKRRKERTMYNEWGFGGSKGRAA